MFIINFCKVFWLSSALGKQGAGNTKSWEIGSFQTVMGTTFVNGYLTFKYITGKELTLREFTNGRGALRRLEEEEGLWR